MHAAYGKVEVLHGVALEVPKGKVITLIGSNGADKTTTMPAISGMIKPKTGKVTFSGHDITGLDSHRIAHAGLAHSPEGRRVFFTMSVIDNLLLGTFPRFTRTRPRGDINRDPELALELFRASRNASTSWPARCPVANNRCWRWRAPSCSTLRSSCSTNLRSDLRPSWWTRYSASFHASRTTG
jgi:ABC-type branched-subunit amino acid transport system ATPase component